MLGLDEGDELLVYVSTHGVNAAACTFEFLLNRVTLNPGDVFVVLSVLNGYGVFWVWFGTGGFLESKSWMGFVLTGFVGLVFALIFVLNKYGKRPRMEIGKETAAEVESLVIV
jgi:hypothetical protein